MRKIVLTLAVTAAAALSMSACDSINLTKKSDSAPAAQAPAAPAADPSAAAATPSAVANVAGVKVAVNDTLGKVVTDWKGWTLYRFEKDAPKPPKSNCAGDCLAKWPAVPYATGFKIEGVDPQLIGKVLRADGSEQLTINGWPAYRYSGDAKVGDTKGQGVNGVWFAFTPEGKKAQAAAVDNGGGGY